MSRLNRLQASPLACFFIIASNTHASKLLYGVAHIYINPILRITLHKVVRSPLKIPCCWVPQAYSQLNCSCYSYPSKPRLQWLQVFRMHIYGISKWLLMQLTHAHTATARVSPHVHYTYTSYVLYAYLYCVYALVSGEISIRDPYLCAVHESVTTNRTLSFTDLLSVQLKRSYRLQNKHRILFRRKKTALGHRSC